MLELPDRNRDQCSTMLMFDDANVMVEQRLSQHRGRGGLRCGNLCIARLVANLEEFLRLRGMLREVIKLLVVELRHDLDFARIGMTTQASQESLVDHRWHIAARFAVECFAQHARRLDVLHAVEEDERLQRRIGSFPFGDADRAARRIERHQRRRRTGATPIRVQAAPIDAIAAARIRRLERFAHLVGIHGRTANLEA